MKLGTITALWLTQSILAFAQSEIAPCPCPEGRSGCTTCVNNLVDEQFTCSTTCTTRCVDFFNDPQNCGFCNNFCKSGLCREGICVVDSCEGGVCGTHQLCSGNSCYCFLNTDGSGFCGLDALCDGLKDCNSNSDCEAGWLCSAKTCCERNVCLSTCEKGGGGVLSEASLAKIAAGKGAAGGGAAGKAR